MNQATEKERDQQEAPFWGGTIKALERGIVIFLHIVTATLAAVALHGTIKGVPTWLAWVMAVAMSLLIERLIHKVLPVTVAAGLRGYWKGGMFWFMAIIALALLCVNPFLSWKGGQQATDMLVPAFQYSNTAKVDNAQARDQAKAGERYAAAIKGLEAQQETISRSIRAKYDAQIAQQERIIAQRRGMVARGHKWAVDKIGPAQNQISRLEAKRDAEIAAAVQGIADKITTQQASAAHMDSVIASQYAVQRETIQAGDEQARKRHDRRYSNIGGVMFLFGVGFEVLLLLCTLIVEYYFRHDQKRYNKAYSSFEKSALGELGAQVVASVFAPLYEFVMLRLERWKIRFEARAAATRAQREANKQLASAKGEIQERLLQAKTAHEIAALNDELRKQLETLPTEFQVPNAAPGISFTPPKIALPTAQTFFPGQTVNLSPVMAKSSVPVSATAPVTLTTSVLENDLHKLADCARQYYKRQFIAARPETREENRVKYQEAKARLEAAEAEVTENGQTVSITLPRVVNS